MNYWTQSLKVKFLQGKFLKLKRKITRTNNPNRRYKYQLPSPSNGRRPKRRATERNRPKNTLSQASSQLPTTVRPCECSMVSTITKRVRAHTTTSTVCKMNWSRFSRRTKYLTRLSMVRRRERSRAPTTTSIGPRGSTTRHRRRKASALCNK